MRWCAFWLGAVSSLGCTSSAQDLAAIESCAEPPCVGVELPETLGACPCDASHKTFAASRAELDEALLQGGCVEVAGFEYRDVLVPHGAQIVGGHYQQNHFGELRFAGGGEASACRVSAAAVVVEAGAAATLQYTHISSSSSDGVKLEEGASVVIAGSTIEDVARYGVSAFGADSVNMVRTAIRRTTGPGLWAQCALPSDAWEDQNCACAPATKVELESVSIDQAGLAGLVVEGATAELRDVAVRRSHMGPNYEMGKGAVFAFCAEVVADRLVLDGNADVGLMIHDASAQLSDVNVSNNLIGLWLEPGQHAIEIERATLHANQGMGIAMKSLGEAAEDGPVKLREVTIDDTAMVSLAVLVGGVSAGAQDVGDGIVWGPGLVAHLDGVAIRESARYDMLVDCPTQGTVNDLEMEDDAAVCENPPAPLYGQIPPPAE